METVRFRDIFVKSAILISPKQFETQWEIAPDGSNLLDPPP